MRKLKSAGQGQVNIEHEANATIMSNPGIPTPGTPRPRKKRNLPQLDLPLFLPEQPLRSPPSLLSDEILPDEVSIAPQTDTAIVTMSSEHQSVAVASNTASLSLPAITSHQAKRFYSPEHYPTLSSKYNKDMFLPTPHDYPGNTPGSLSFLDPDCEPNDEDEIIQRLKVVKNWNLAMLRNQMKQKSAVANVTATTAIENPNSDDAVDVRTSTDSISVKPF